MKRLFLSLLTIATLAFGPVAEIGPARGQDAPAAARAVEAESPSPAPVSDPLPTPDFARAYRHVFLAFAFAWVLIFGYAVFIDRRIVRASEELDRLR